MQEIGTDWGEGEKNSGGAKRSDLSRCPSAKGGLVERTPLKSRIGYKSCEGREVDDRGVPNAYTGVGGSRVPGGCLRTSREGRPESWDG